MAVIYPPTEFTYLKNEGRHFAVGDRYSRKNLRKIENCHPYIKDRVFTHYLRINDSSNYHKADAWLEGLIKRLWLTDKFSGLHTNSDFEEIDQFAEQTSKRMEIEFYDFAARTNPEIALDYINDQVEQCGLIFPVKEKDLRKKDPVVSGLLRVFDPRWWKRQLYDKAFRQSEAVYRELGIVSANSQVYVSDHNYKRYLFRQADNQRLLESMEAINEEGYAANLRNLADRSVSNPVNRRNEFMTRIGGIEDFAEKAGHSAVFYTLTCPSKYHAMHKSGKANAKFAGFNPKVSNDYLNSVWRKVRAAWARENIECYGVRVVEPHHDGTPHWHLLLFMPEEQLDRAEAIFRKYALAEDSDEAGAEENRFDSVLIDSEKGRATGYVAKYISKCIDGYGVGEDHYGNDAVQSAFRIRAWASIWGIRQFQFIGIPSVTVYRELRRLRNVEGVREGLIKQLEEAADDGDWQKFVELMGGVNVPLKDQPLRAMMIPKKEPNSYGEISFKIKGLLGFAGEVITRTTDWEIRFARKTDEDGFLSVRGANAPPWSSVNNCTRRSYQTLMGT